jgi:acetoin utilization protein AcuB
MIIRINTFQTDALEKDLEANGYKVLNISKNPN